MKKVFASLLLFFTSNAFGQVINQDVMTGGGGAVTNYESGVAIKEDTTEYALLVTDVDRIGSVFVIKSAEIKKKDGDKILFVCHTHQDIQLSEDESVTEIPCINNDEYVADVDIAIEKITNKEKKKYYSPRLDVQLYFHETNEIKNATPILMDEEFIASEKKRYAQIQSELLKEKNEVAADLRQKL